MTGDDSETEETPSPEEETTSMWQDDARPILLVAGVPIDDLASPALLRSA